MDRGTVHLEKNDVIEIELPDGDSVWVYANGTVHRQKVSRDTSGTRKERA